MSNNATTAEERTDTDHPRPTRVCAVCGDEGHDVRRLSDLEHNIKPHTVHPSCSFNPLTDSREEYLEVLRE
jgi:hypothetical protein